MIAMRQTYHDIYYKCVNAYYDTEYHLGRWKTYFEDLIHWIFLTTDTGVSVRNQDDDLDDLAGL